MEMEQAYAYFASQKFNHFEVGDRVTVLEEYGTVGYGDETSYKERTGLSGTVCVPADKYTEVGIRFDEFMNGHDCDGHCKLGYGWFVPYKYIIPEVETPSIPKDKLMEVLLNG